ncbi:MAG: hypothetical protein WCD86_04140 [Ktedonobacteraceae bacterium]
MEILDQSAGTAINTSEQAQPVLEAEHLRKIFPLRQANPLGTKQGVHAVDDASLALYCCASTCYSLPCLCRLLPGKDASKNANLLTIGSLS